MTRKVLAWVSVAVFGTLLSGGILIPAAYHLLQIGWTVGMVVTMFAVLFTISCAFIWAVLELTK